MARNTWKININNTLNYLFHLKILYYGILYILIAILTRYNNRGHLAVSLINTFCDIKIISGWWLMMLKNLEKYRRIIYE